MVPNTENKVLCLECQVKIHLGMGGIQNYYKQHKGRKKCEENKKEFRKKEALKKQQLAAQNYFAPCPPKVPTTVTAPAPIRSTLLSQKSTDPYMTVNENPFSKSANQFANLNKSPPPCPVALKILAKFHARIISLPPEVDEADKRDG